MPRVPKYHAGRARRDAPSRLDRSGGTVRKKQARKQYAADAGNGRLACRKKQEMRRRNEKRKPEGFLFQFGAGNETCTRTVSRCFPITFFVGLASEDLNCSLVFRPRQQIRPKSSTDVQRAALSTPDPRSVHRRRQLPRTHHPRPVVCPASITAKTIRQMVLVMAQLGCHLGTPAPQLTGDLLVKLL